MFMFIPVGGTAGSVEIPSNGGGPDTSLAIADMLLKDGATAIIGLERSWFRVRACGWLIWKGLIAEVDDGTVCPKKTRGKNSLAYLKAAQIKTYFT